MKILNWFPKPKALTELTLLSKFELIIYCSLFLFLFFIYYSWNRIPIHDIYIEVDRVDTDAWNDSLYSYLTGGTIENKYISNRSSISILFPFSISLNDDDSINHLIKISNNAYYINNKHDISVGLDLVNISNKNYTDSLLSIARNYITDNRPIFYSNIRTINHSNIGFRDYFKNVFMTDSLDKRVYLFQSNFKQNSLFETEKETWTFANRFSIDNKQSVFRYPSLFSLYDISQCFYRIHIRSHLVSQIDLKMRFLGANEFIFIKNEPDSISGQELFFDITNPHRVYGIKRDICFHVNSRELAGLQSTRVFFVTTILSALVTILLAFFIIYFYRRVQPLFSMKQLADDEELSNNMNKNKSLESRKPWKIKRRKRR